MAVEVAFDEAGNDGENLFGGNAKAFVHDKLVFLRMHRESPVAKLRRRTNAQSADLKSKDLLEGDGERVLDLQRKRVGMVLVEV